jgi:hypothetical protein
MPYSMYQLYQAERIKTAAEYRQADLELSRMAAAVSQLRADTARPLRALWPVRARHARARHDRAFARRGSRPVTGETEAGCPARS